MEHEERFRILLRLTAEDTYTDLISQKSWVCVCSTGYPISHTTERYVSCYDKISSEEAERDECQCSVHSVIFPYYSVQDPSP